MGEEFGGAGGDDLPALGAAFGAEVDEPVGVADDLEVVLDDEEAGAFFDELFEGVEEAGDVVEMEAGRGFVEQVQGAFVGGLGEMGGEFDALGFAAGEGGGGLAETEVAEADVGHGLKAGEEAGGFGEEAEGFADGELEDLVDVEALVADVEDGGFVACAAAVLADEFDIGEELHFDGDGAIALAGFAAAADDVEGEVAGGVAAFVGFGCPGEKVANDVEGF